MARKKIGDGGDEDGDDDGEDGNEESEDSDSEEPVPDVPPECPQCLCPMRPHNKDGVYKSGEDNILRAPLLVAPGVGHGSTDPALV